jgi:hypothetical protein
MSARTANTPPIRQLPATHAEIGPMTSVNKKPKAKSRADFSKPRADFSRGVGSSEATQGTVSRPQDFRLVHGPSFASPDRSEADFGHEGMALAG